MKHLTILTAACCLWLTTAHAQLGVTKPMLVQSGTNVLLTQAVASTGTNNVTLTGALTTIGTIAKTVTDPATPEVLGGANITFKSIFFKGLKTARTNNTSTVWIIFDSGATTPGIDLLPGQGIGIEAPPGQYFNASQFYLEVGTTNDGVTATYFN